MDLIYKPAMILHELLILQCAKLARMARVANLSYTFRTVFIATKVAALQTIHRKGVATRCLPSSNSGAYLDSFSIAIANVHMSRMSGFGLPETHMKFFKLALSLTVRIAHFSPVQSLGGSPVKRESLCRNCFSSSPKGSRRTIASASSSYWTARRKSPPRAYTQPTVSR
jgi:hypothetical protein